MPESNNVNKKNYVQNLPEEILYHMIQYLDFFDLLTLRSINHFFKNKIEKTIVWKVHQQLWKVHQQYPGIPALTLKVLLEDSNNNVKLLYNKLNKANQLLDEFKKNNQPLFSFSNRSYKQKWEINDETIKNELIGQDKKYMWTILLLKKNILNNDNDMVRFVSFIDECYGQYFKNDNFYEYLLFVTQDKSLFKVNPNRNKLDFKYLLRRLNTDNKQQFKILLKSLLATLEKSHLCDILDFLIENSGWTTNQWRLYMNEVVNENFPEYGFSSYIKKEKISEAIQLLNKHPECLQKIPHPFEYYVELAIKKKNPEILELLFQFYLKTLTEDQQATITEIFFDYIGSMIIEEEKSILNLNTTYDDWEKTPRLWIEKNCDDSDIAKVASILFKNGINLLDALKQEQYKKKIQYGKHNGFETIFIGVKNRDSEKTTIEYYNQSRYTNFQKWLTKIYQSISYLTNNNNNQKSLQDYLSELPDEILYNFFRNYFERNQLLQLKRLSKWFNEKITKIDQDWESGFGFRAGLREAEILKLIQTENYDESFTYKNCGMNAKIYQAQLKTTNEDVAIKIFNNGVKQGVEYKVYYLGLSQLTYKARHIRHPNLVSYYGFGIKETEYDSAMQQRRGNFAIVMEYLPPITTYQIDDENIPIQTVGNFMDCYQRDRNRNPDKIPSEFHNLKDIPYEMIKAIEVLHNQSQPVYHGQLNSLHKLLLWKEKDKFHIKISSWGTNLVNKHMKGTYNESAKDAAQFTSVDTPYYSATPEEFTENYDALEPYSPWLLIAKDVYQIFLLILDALFKNQSQPRIFRHQNGKKISEVCIPTILKNQHYVTEIPKNAPPILQQIGFFALHPNPKVRPTVQSALNCIDKGTVPEKGFKDWEQFKDQTLKMK